MPEFYMPVVSDNEYIDKALYIAWQFSQIDGAHHKAWVIDQMVRALCGTEEKYREYVDAYTKPFVNDAGDEDYYDWDEGIVP
jgi:hypothetical protein